MYINFITVNFIMYYVNINILQTVIFFIIYRVSAESNIEQNLKFNGNEQIYGKREEIIFKGLIKNEYIILMLNAFLFQRFILIIFNDIKLISFFLLIHMIYKINFFLINSYNIYNLCGIIFYLFSKCVCISQKL